MVRIFEVTAPDGRKLRREAVSAARLKKELLAGYIVTGEVLDCLALNTGGYLVPVQDDDSAQGTLLGYLLQRDGAAMLAWIKDKIASGDLTLDAPKPKAAAKS